MIRDARTIVKITFVILEFFWNFKILFLDRFGLRDVRTVRACIRVRPGPL